METLKTFIQNNNDVRENVFQENGTIAGNIPHSPKNNIYI